MAKKLTILVAEHDAYWRGVMTEALRGRGYRAIEAGTPEAALRTHRMYRPDLVLLDLVMPGLDALEVCRQLRSQYHAPILLTADAGGIDDIALVKPHVDDYMTKPFAPEELSLRVKLLLDRVMRTEAPERIRYGELVIQPETSDVSCRGRTIPFLAKELKLFLFMAVRPRRIFSTDDLYDRVWGHGEGDLRTVMVHISNIRKKLARYAPDTVHIETVKGLGYRLVPVEHDHTGPSSPMIKEAIIDAATCLFAEHGYEGMTMKEIASRVGIHASTIYQYFANKEDLFVHIYRNVLRGHLQIAADSTERPLPARERLEGMLRSVIHYQIREASKMKVYIRVLLFPSGYFEQDMKDELKKIERIELEWFSELLREGMASGEIRQDDEERLARLLICIMDGLFWEMQRFEPDEFLERFNMVWEQFWALIRA